MRNAFITLAVAALALSMYSCKTDRSDFDAREEKLAKEIEKIDVQTTYRDIMMLYFDIIEDVYNQGKETGEYDLKRLEDFEDGILKDFSEKLDIGSKDFWEEEDDKFGESLSDRINTLRPMMETVLAK